MDEFSFPFQPYDIQLRLMREIRECIERRQVGIFESPTGTGKSLSVLCSTMTWLENEEKQTDEKLQEMLRSVRMRIQECNEQTTDWMEAEEKKMVAKTEEGEIIEQIEERKRLNDRIEQARKGTIEVSRKRKTGKFPTTETSLDEEPKDELAPSEEYHSDGEDSSKKNSEYQEEEEEKEEEKPLKCLKIYYASRTHSQLEQLVEELGKTRFRPRVVTCASRGTLCVNEDVKKLKLNHLINERCMELRKNGIESGEKKQKTGEGTTKKCKKTCATSCEFYNSTQIEDVVNGVLSNTLTTTMQVTKQGKMQMGCPYFATRKAVPQCQLVLLPYQVLLHDGTRQAWGIDLKDNVVILDEAHNVLSTISSLYSAEISTKSLTLAFRLIREYIETYKLRLKAKNLLYMKQLESLTNKMILFLNGQSKEDVMTMAQFARLLNILEMNLFKLAAYIENTDLCKKFHGFYLRMQRNEVKKENEKPKLTGIQKLMMAKKEEEEKVEEVEPVNVAPPRPIPSPLFSLKSFIDALTNKCEDGRIIVERTPTEAKFRFMLLNPADRLAEVINSSRATVLVGGTMEPAQLLVETLSRGSIGPESIRRFSCAHVIDDSQLLAVTVEKTLNGKPFQLTYQTRSNESTLKSLGLSIQTLVPHLPNGVVIFVPSYDFLYNFQKKMTEFGIMKRIEEKKSVFTESRLPTSDVWERFTRAARTSKGAIFFAVVGGKMSEGINFCDELGRAVIVIGLPYPNKTSVELKERMRFLDSQMPNGGSMLYESLCMHAVNQAIGRAIRHRKDYAAVYLFDERYAKEATRNKLSAWIGDRTQTHLEFGEIIRKTKAFFESNKANN